MRGTTFNGPASTGVSVSENHTVTMFVSSASGTTTPWSWCHSVAPMIGCPVLSFGRYFSGGLMRTCCTGLEDISGPMSSSNTSSMFSLTNALKTAGPNQHGVSALTSWNGSEKSKYCACCRPVSWYIFRIRLSKGSSLYCEVISPVW